MTPHGDAGYDHPGPGPGKTLLILFGVATVLFVGLVGATAYAAHSLATHPWVEVRITEHDGERETVRVSIPMAVAGTAVAVAPYLMPEDARRDVEDGLAEYEEWAPVARELADQLERMPDATLVEVEGGPETVRVSKRGGDLLVEVRAADADVDVTVPVRLVRDAVHALR